MSKKQNRINILIQVHERLEVIKKDSKNQNAKSIEENMSILSDAILDVLAIDNIKPMSAD